MAVGGSPELVVIDTRGPEFFRPVRDLIHSGDLLWLMVRRHLKVRFAQTALGAVWVVCQPLMSAAIFSVLFGVFVKAPSDGLPYVVFAYPGIVLWALFAQGFERGNTSFLADERMITKVYFPRLVLPVAASFSAVIDFGISMLLAFPICFAFGVVPGMELFYAALAIPPVLMAATTCGIVFASLSIRYRDFRQVAPFVIQLWFYATPVVYSLKSVPVAMQPYILVNPMTVPVVLIRHAFTGSGLPPLWSVVVCYGESFVLAILALAVFRTVERRMADWL